MAVIERSLPNNIDFMDGPTSSVVFRLLTVIETSMPFVDEHEHFVWRIAEKCIEFTGHTAGSDYKDLLLEIRVILRSIVWASLSRFALRIGNRIKEAVQISRALTLGK
jgi:hypothetical protein